MKNTCNKVHPIFISKFSESRNSVIKYVILTHIHADFVAGHVDLAKITGA